MADVSQISAVSVPSSTEPDVKTQLEALNYDKQRLEHENQQLRNLGLRQDIDARKIYANRIFCLIVAWLVGMFVLLYLQGTAGLSVNLERFPFVFTSKHFALSDNVILAAIGGTTASVLGIFIIVANYLFPNVKTDKATGSGT